MSRYFPAQNNTPAEQLERPNWAKGVPLTDEAREAAAGPSHPRRDSKWARSLAAEYTRAAVEALADCLDDEDGRVRVAAATALYQMAWGKPAQAITGADGGPVRVATEPEALHARIVAVVSAGVGEAGEVRALPELGAARPA